MKLKDWNKIFNKLSHGQSYGLWFILNKIRGNVEYFTFEEILKLVSSGSPKTSNATSNTTQTEL